MRPFKRKRHYPSSFDKYKKRVDPWTIIISIFVFSLLFFILALITIKIYPYICTQYLR